MRKFFNDVSDFFKRNPNGYDGAIYTKLQRAVVNNDLAKIEILLKAGANVNLGSSFASPPLHLGIMYNHQMAVLTLLKAGADVNRRDKRGYTPLHYAVEHGQESFVIALLKSGADPNIVDNAGKSPLHLVPRSAPQLIDILAKYKADVGLPDAAGDTPLHLFLDEDEMAQKLLTYGADPNARNRENVSPYTMMLADYRLLRHQSTLQMMFALKADVDAVNHLGETILHLSARLEMENVFFAKMTCANLLAVDFRGNNVLHVLAKTQNARMVTQVLLNAQGLIHDKNNAGQTPLEELVRHTAQFNSTLDGKFIATALLFLAYKAKPDSTDRAGRSLLHHAVIHDKMDFLDLLMIKGLNPDLVDNNGKTALHYAIERKNICAMDILLDGGTDPDMTDDRGWTILDRLAESGDRDSPRVQRLIVGGGQYNKQLPLHPEMIRRPRMLDKDRHHKSGDVKAPDSSKPFSGGNNKNAAAPPPRP